MKQQHFFLLFQSLNFYEKDYDDDSYKRQSRIIDKVKTIYESKLHRTMTNKRPDDESHSPKSSTATNADIKTSRPQSSTPLDISKNS